MGVGLWFWVMMLFAVVTGLWGIYPGAPGPPWRGSVAGLFLFVAVVFLGIAVFGGPIKG